ncbi:MAG TPA: DUF4142 domain-containing protein [Phycisphaerae bacterium]|nr:DUF4142 domain-containing protein [Phycisphaerae bacterium]
MFKTTLVAFAVTLGAVGMVPAAEPAAPAAREAAESVDRAFVVTMISHVRLQNQIGKLVAEKAPNPEIKKFAQEFVDESEKIQAKIAKAAEKADVKIDQDRLLPSDQARLDAAKELPARALQRHYIFEQAGETETHLLMAQWAAKNAEKPEIKEVAAELATKIEARRDAAQKLAQGEVNAPRMATEK